MALEGGVESIPAQVVPAPELPPPVLGAFMACANTWRDKAKAKASEAFAIQALEKENASLKEEKETLARRCARQEEAYKDSLKLAQKAKEEASKRLHEAGQAHAELLGQVVPLHVQVVDLKDTVETSKAQQKKLEDHSVDREKKLAKTEAALEAKINSCHFLEAEITTLRAEMTKALEVKDQERVAVVAAKDEELASQAKHFQETEERLC